MRVVVSLAFVAALSVTLARIRRRRGLSPAASRCAVVAVGASNFIWQFQPGFHSPYEGANSFRSDDHRALSFVATIYGGYQLTRTTAIVLDGESAGGSGLSEALGLAGFTNLDVVRNPALGPTPYLGARVHRSDHPALAIDWVAADRDPLHVLRALPDRRIELRAGKIERRLVRSERGGSRQPPAVPELDDRQQRRVRLRRRHARLHARRRWPSTSRRSSRCGSASS